MSSRRRTSRTSRISRLAVAAAVVALLGACGSVGGAGSGTSVAGKGGPARIKIAGASRASLSSASAAGAAPAADAAKVAPGMAVRGMPFRPVVYQVAGTLPSLDGDAQAWTYPAGAADVTTSAVSKLARGLGLAGQVTPVPADEGGGFRVGPNDGSGPTLNVSADALASWWYSDSVTTSSGVACSGGGTVSPGLPTDDPVAAADGATTVVVAPDCPAPAPPDGVPTEAEARTAAVALAKALGRTVADDDIVVSGDAYGRYATMYDRLDGVRSPLAMSASWGAKGDLQYANGTLATPRKADRYPRIGTGAALDALKAGDTGWFGGPVPMMGAADGATDVAVEPAAAPVAGSGVALGAVSGSSGGASSGAAGGSGGAPAIAPGEPSPSCPGPAAGTADTVAAPGVATKAVPCLPIDTVPAPDGSSPEVTIDPPVVDTTPVVTTITEVRESFVQLYGVDGQVWLLPGYEFVTDDNGSIVVPAVDKSYVEVVQPTTPAPEPGAKPLPVPETAVAEQPAPAPAPAPAGDPATAPPVTAAKP